MPVYEYVCEECSARFDTRVSTWSEADPVECRSCASENVRRLISRVAFMSPGSDLPMAKAESSGGGCCGGHCGCGHG